MAYDELSQKNPNHLSKARCCDDSGRIVATTALPGFCAAANLLFTVPFWCAMGIAVDVLYRVQAVWFGAYATFPVVVMKVLVDQFVYNPLFAAPCTAVLYDWKNRGYGFHGLGDFFTTRYYRNVVVPTLFATWGVWIPIVSILYSLPSLLQIPLFGLALSMWVMIYTWMSERRVDPP